MTIKNFIAAAAMVVFAAPAFAQSDMSNEALSAQYKNEIAVLKAEIKTLKAKQKAEPTNADYVTEMAQKKADLKDRQDKKKTIDKAIKTEKAHKKAQAKLEKAQRQMENAAKDAEKVKKGK